MKELWLLTDGAKQGVPGADGTVNLGIAEALLPKWDIVSAIVEVNIETAVPGAENIPPLNKRKF